MTRQRLTGMFVAATLLAATVSPVALAATRESSRTSIPDGAVAVDIRGSSQGSSLAVKTGGTDAPDDPPTIDEIDIICDDWLVMWDEDEAGQPVSGTAEVWCEGEKIWPEN